MKISDENKILKGLVRGKKIQHSTYRKMINYCRLSIRNNASHRTQNILKVLKVNIIQSGILYPAKRSFENKGEIKDKSWKKFVNKRPV